MYSSGVRVLAEWEEARFSLEDVGGRDELIKIRRTKTGTNDLADNTDLQVGNSLDWPPRRPDIVGVCEYQAWLAGCFLASYPPFTLNFIHLLSIVGYC